MSKLTIEISAPVEEFITIVNELGYQSQVLNPEQISTTIPNPENQQTFLQNYVKKLIVDDFTKAKVKAIDNAIRDERIAEKEALKTAIANAVTVTFTV